MHYENEVFNLIYWYIWEKAKILSIIFGLLQSKLSQLQSLVVQLLQEKQQLHPYMHQAHTPTGSQALHDQHNAFMIEDGQEATEKMDQTSDDHGETQNVLLLFSVFQH